MRLILLLVLLTFVGGASTTEYYISTTGNDAHEGNLTHPWLTLAYADGQLYAGDTLYMFNGTWTNEHFVFARSGNATHPITLTAYNGTPILDGVDKTGVGVRATDYVNVNGLKIVRCNIPVCMVALGSSYVNISNCVLGDAGDSLVSIIGDHVWVRNCTLYAPGWNTLQLNGLASNKSMTHQIHILDNYFYNTSAHTGGVDIMTDTWDIDIIGNTFNDSDTVLYVHLQHLIGSYRINVSNNVFRNMGGAAIDFMWTRDSVAINNTVYDSTENAIYAFSGSAGRAKNLTIKNNKVYSAAQMDYRLSVKNETGNPERGKLLFVDNNLNTPNTEYVIEAGTTNSTMQFTQYTAKFKTYVQSYAKNQVVFTDGRVFTQTISSYSTYILTKPRYFPTHSNSSLEDTDASGSDTLTVTAYNITLLPTNSHLKDVTVSHESDAADDRTTISVNSSVSSNPTWINATMQNSSNTYNVSIDGAYTAQVVSDANKIVRYQYTSSWSPHTFEFDWFSGEGFSGAPDPTNIANTTGETWVRHSWSAGAGNVIDSYNVSVNSVWHNTTTNAYHNNTGLSPETWSNVTVWAFNNTGGISQNSISQNSQSDASSWSPSSTAIYYNISSTIEITTKTDGTNLFGRTPTQADGNATSGRLVVTI